jgi:hypothetical protein
LNALLFLAGLALVLGAALTQGGLAVLTDQATIPDNTFITADSFATSTPTDTPTVTLTPTDTPTPTPTPTPTNTGFLDCSSNAAVTSSSGDNNGFQLNSANTCSDDAAFAEDTNSGTNTNTSCANTGKDRHLFYDYGLTIPAGSTINGIEARLDAWIDGGSGASRIMCVELSWNGGSSWTAVKTTSTLGTTQATFTLGTTTDTWGRTWASGDFSNANFRVRITDVAASTARDFRLDWVAVRVTYTPP